MQRALLVGWVVVCAGCGPAGPGDYCRALEDPCSPRCDRRSDLAAACDGAFDGLYADERANLDACAARCGGLVPPCGCSSECAFSTLDESCTRCTDRCTATDASCSCLARCGTAPAVRDALAAFYDCAARLE